MIYLDNAATTKTDKEIGYFIGKLFMNSYGNASSSHLIGMNYKNLFLKARKNIADYMNCKPENIIFTSGATESNNTAIKNIVDKAARGKRRLLVSEVEHPSVLEPVKRYQAEGKIDVEYIPVNKDCCVCLEYLKKRMGNDVAGVVVMAVNNEMGSIQPVKEIAELCRFYNAAFHCDYVQAFGKIPFYPECVDFASFSAHKIYGPKGIGILYVKKPEEFCPLIYGGGQQGNKRSGTEPVELILALEMTVKNLFEHMEDNNNHIYRLKKRLLEGLRDSDKVSINSPDNAVPHIVNLSISGIRSDVISLIFEQKGIMVSQGSACSSNHGEKILSHVLMAMGFPEERIRSSFRISFGKYNTVEEIDYVVSVITEAIEKYSIRREKHDRQKNKNYGSQPEFIHDPVTSGERSR